MVGFLHGTVDRADFRKKQMNAQNHCYETSARSSQESESDRHPAVGMPKTALGQHQWINLIVFSRQLGETTDGNSAIISEVSLTHKLDVYGEALVERERHGGSA